MLSRVRCEHVFLLTMLLTGSSGTISFCSFTWMHWASLYMTVTILKKFYFCLTLKCLHLHLTCSSLSTSHVLPACSQRGGLTGKKRQVRQKASTRCSEHLKEVPRTFFRRKVWRWLRAMGRTSSRAGMGSITLGIGSSCGRSWPGRKYRASQSRTWKDSSSETPLCSWPFPLLSLVSVKDHFPLNFRSNNIIKLSLLASDSLSHPSNSLIWCQVSKEGLSRAANIWPHVADPCLVAINLCIPLSRKSIWPTQLLHSCSLIVLHSALLADWLVFKYWFSFTLLPTPVLVPSGYQNRSWWKTVVLGEGAHRVITTIKLTNKGLKNAAALTISLQNLMLKTASPWIQNAILLPQLL